MKKLLLTFLFCMVAFSSFAEGIKLYGKEAEKILNDGEVISNAIDEYNQHTFVVKHQSKIFLCMVNETKEEMNIWCYGL